MVSLGERSETLSSDNDCDEKNGNVNDSLSRNVRQRRERLLRMIYETRRRRRMQQEMTKMRVHACESEEDVDGSCGSRDEDDDVLMKKESVLRQLPLTDDDVVRVPGGLEL